MATPGRIAKSYLQNSIEFRAQPKRKWTVVQEFGSMGGGINGGIAKVKTDDPLNRFFIEKRFSRDDIFYGCAHREIALLHQVGDHPNITRLYDHFVDEKANKASMYMEFCNMGSLQDVSVKVQQGQRLNEHKLWRWFIDSMEAITYCHRGHEPDNDKAVANWSRVYHRDIKPANILLTLKEKGGKKQLIAKLADFGGSQSDEWTWQTKSKENASRTSTTTPGFDPPEYPKYSGSSDVWQMGLVFLCLSGLQGMPPKSGQNPTGKQWDKVRPAGPNYSVEFSLTLRWCLTEDSKLRPGSNDVLKRLKSSYETMKNRLPPDPHPLEIFSPSGGQAPPPPAAQPQAQQPPQRPGPPGHVMSNPEAGRVHNGPHNYAHQVAGQRAPGGMNQNQGYYGGQGPNRSGGGYYR